MLLRDPPLTIFDWYRMTLDDYQRAALQTVNPGLGPTERLLDAAAGLAEEAGEVLGLVRKQLFQHRDSGRERFIEELGDALWCLSITADALGISLGEVGDANLEKLQRRHPDGFQAESSLTIASETPNRGATPRGV